ncbi:MAG: cation:proton antiporter [Pseudonocardia sp.]
MEIDHLSLLGLTLIAVGARCFAASCGVAVGIGATLYAANLIDEVWVVVAALLTTSIGIVVVVLKDSGRLETPVGQLSLLGALLGDVASVALLSVLFVGAGGTVAGQLRSRMNDGMTILMTTCEMDFAIAAG